MKSFKFPQEPIYIPKVQDSNITRWGLHLPAVCVNAFTLLAWRQVTVGVSKNADAFIVDPVTDRMLSGHAKDKKNFRKLNYPDVEPEQIYSDAGIRSSLIKQTIANQEKATLLIAPYFFAEDTDDTKFSINLTLLSETIQYLIQKKDERPLFAMICIGNSVLTRPNVLNHIIDRYNDDFSSYIQGFFLSVNDLNGRNARDENRLLGLAHFIYRLSEYKPVIIKRMDALGEVLCAIGAAGYSSGLAASETYSVKSQESSKRRALRRIYSPEVFDYLNDEEAKKIDYECHRESNPSGTHPESHQTKTQHYLHHRLDRMKAMQHLTREQRIDYMLREISKAKKVAAKWSDEFGIPPKFLHAPRWATILERAKHWMPSRQNDEELAHLLEELESDD